MFVIPQVRTARPARSSVLAPSLARMIDRMLDDASQAAASDPVRTPALDVDETDREYLVRLDVPGIERDRLQVTIEGRRVSIETVDAEPATADAGAGTAPAEAAPQQPGKTDGVPRALYRERSAARYARSLALPKEVSSEQSEARLENGVLTLRLPKRVADGARRLAIG